jgi:hypothetical protein
MTFCSIKCKRLLAFAVIASLALLGFAPRSYAVNINTSAVNCDELNLPTAQSTTIFHFLTSIRNNSTDNKAIICAVPRSPLTSASSGFFIDGQNPNGAGTGCSVVVTNFNGAPLGLKSFFNEQPVFDQFLAFNSTEMPTFAYISVFCELPPGGVLRGITAVQ